MISLLIIISFLLHFIAFFAIYMLFQQLQNVKKQDMDEIIKLFDTYLQEVKAENNRLQRVLRDNEKTNENSNMGQARTEADTMEEPEIFPIPEDAGDTVEASLESRVLQLHNQGVPVGEIARKLNCGKTEAEIIIKLHEKMQ
ncbi:hypothetical protein NSQ77_19475 [Oceanobacillus sp. FSL K6-2867]|uniref:DUF6115 domain-containing protein n=1 Tax=Oceanobacillus sp. FSL K6-2867 TaxID=2954748 RepID=UPI0030DDB635